MNLKSFTIEDQQFYVNAYDSFPFDLKRIGKIKDKELKEGDITGAIVASAVLLNDGEWTLYIEGPDITLHLNKDQDHLKIEKIQDEKTETDYTVSKTFKLIKN
jgi:hypothetical protein